MSFHSNYEILSTTSGQERKRKILTKKVRMMASLPPGFSHGEGVPVREEAIARAEEFILLASQLELDADVFPNMEGGCAVAFYKGEGRVEVSIGPDGNKFDLRFEHGIGFQLDDVVPPTQDAGFDQVVEQILTLWIFDEAIWKLYASSTSEISTELAGDSEMSFLETLPSRQSPLLLQMVEGGSRSSMLPVLA